SAQFHTPCQQAMQGCISMDINAHGIENTREADFYEELAEEKYEAYPRWGMDGPPEKAYFCNMFLRVRRALDYLCADPLWDGANLWIMGFSQGALQSFAGAFLDKRVTAMAAGVPAGCDLTGFAIDRVTGWPRPDLLFLDGDSTVEDVLGSAPYFDNVNFARNITIPMIMSIGFVDITCKPTTVYAAYNAFQGPKEKLDKPRMGHEGGFDSQQAFLSFVMQQKK
ncbi:MAG: acetylxylan esterase, partial [Planctomycetes bacterium]|nr:acetylxylan esterase [Planctomycetota bacterium]